MKVYFVLPPIERFSPLAGGAISTFAWQMSRRLRASGHETSVIAPRGDEPIYEDVPSATFAAPERDTLGVLRRAVSKVDRLARRRDWMYYDVYLSRLMPRCRALDPPDWWVGFNDLQIGLALKQHCLPGKRAIRLSNECRTRHRHPQVIFAAYDQILAVSGYIKSWTTENYPAMDSAKVSILPNGADLQQFTPRADFDAVTDTVKVLFVGRIDPNKGPDLAADAVLRLQQQGLDASITVVGARWFGQTAETPTPYEERLQKTVAAAGGEMMGHVCREDLPQVFREHDVVCVLSRSQEPMSQVVFEAMASGCAVLVSDRGGQPEAVGTAGVQVDPDDFDAVVAGLERLVTDMPWLIQQKRRSLARAASMSWDHTSARLCDALQLSEATSGSQALG